MHQITECLDRNTAHASALLASSAGSLVDRHSALLAHEFIDERVFKRAFDAAERVARGDYPNLIEIQSLEKELEINIGRSLLVLIMEGLVAETAAYVGNSALAAIRCTQRIVTALEKNERSGAAAIIGAKECVDAWLEASRATDDVEYKRVILFVSTGSKKLAAHGTEGTIGDALPESLVADIDVLKKDCWSMDEERVEQSVGALNIADVSENRRKVSSYPQLKTKPLEQAACRVRNPDGYVVPLTVIAAMIGGTLGTLVFSNDGTTFLTSAAVFGAGAMVLAWVLDLLAGQRKMPTFYPDASLIVSEDNVGESAIGPFLPQGPLRKAAKGRN